MCPEVYFLQRDYYDLYAMYLYSSTFCTQIFALCKSIRFLQFRLSCMGSVSDFTIFETFSPARVTDTSLLLLPGSLVSLSISKTNSYIQLVHILFVWERPYRSFESWQQAVSVHRAPPYDYGLTSHLSADLPCDGPSSCSCCTK